MIAILYNIRSVHNVGSIFRTADAVGVEKIYLYGITPSPLDRFGNKRTDFVKASLGAEDYVPWEKISASENDKNLFELFSTYRKNGYTIISLEQSDGSIPYTQALSHIKKSPVMLVVGNEVQGLSKEILSVSDITIEIPMRGSMIRDSHHPKNHPNSPGKESLNVSVAFGIAVYELEKKGTRHK